MRKNLSHQTIISMYYSLAHEAWEFWGNNPIARPIPPVRIKPLYNLFGRSMEFDFFGDRDPGYAMAQTDFVRDDLFNATQVVINEFWIPSLYEDEVIVNILHELAHAHVGFEADHGPVWAKAAEEIGAYPEPALLTRGAWNEEIDWFTPETYSLMRQNNRGPTLEIC